jgi:hypothetical protein
MFFRSTRLQFESKPDKPDPVYARAAGPELRAASVPASLLFDSYLPLVFLGFRSDRLTALP